MNRMLLAAGAAMLAGAATFAIAQPMNSAGMPITRAQALADLRARFTAIDANKDGFVSRDELPVPAGMPIVRSGGPDMLFDEMDKDRNGQISRAEFDGFHSAANNMTVIDGGGQRRVTIIRRPAPGQEAAGMMPGGSGMPGMPGMAPRGALGLNMLFDRVDANSDGKLSAAEAEAAALARFDRVDDNHDGTISLEERRAHAPRRMAMRWRQDPMDRWDRMPPPPPPMPPAPAQ